MVDEGRDILAEVFTDEPVESESSRIGRLAQEESERQDAEEKAQAEQERKAREQENAQKRKDRALFLNDELTLDDKYRQCYVRVQWMKTRVGKVFQKTDEENYSLPLRAKRYLSRFEHHRKQLMRAEADAALAASTGQPAEWKKKSAKALQYEKNCLFFSHAIGMLYNQFKENAPYGKL